MAFKIGRDLVGLVSFRHEVELVLERLHEVLEDLLRVIGGQLRHMLFGQRRQMGYQAHIGFNSWPDPRALNLEHHFRPVLQGRPMHLRQGSGSEWCGFDLLEDLFERCSQIFLDLRTKLGEIQRGRLPLSFSNSVIHSGPNRSGRVARIWLKLDKGRSEDFKNPAYTLGMVKSVRCHLRAANP